MPDPTNFEARLADAMRRYADRAPTDVDAMALAAEIASASAEETHRRPRWWPFGHKPHENERSRTMFTMFTSGLDSSTNRTNTRLG